MPGTMRNYKPHPAGLLFLMVIFSLAAGCGGDEPGGNLPPEGARQSTVAATAPAAAPRPAEIPGRTSAPGKPAGVQAQTGVTEAPLAKPAQPYPTSRAPNMPAATATPEPTNTPPPVAHVPASAPVPAPEDIYDYAAVTTGRAYICLLRNDGAALCTGTVDSETPLPIAGRGPGVHQFGPQPRLRDSE